MSYSACDFVQDCSDNAAQYELPDLPPGRLENMGIDPVDLDAAFANESEQQRVLAERVACAMSDYQSFRAALEGIAKAGGAAAAIARDALAASSFNPAPGEL